MGDPGDMRPVDKSFRSQKCVFEAEGTLLEAVWAPDAADDASESGGQLVGIRQTRRRQTCGRRRATRNRSREPLLLAVDAGLLLYWTAVFLDLIPEEQRFRDYSNPIMQAWNWSFFPLDLSAALLGFLGVYLVRKGRAAGELVVTVGLTLTFCAGFMALSFWSYYGDFNLWWWLPNAALVLAPVVGFLEMSIGKVCGRKA